MAALTGRCGCGTVRFEVDRPFLSASYCHCTRCQHRTGSGAAATARAEPGSVRILQGADRDDVVRRDALSDPKSIDAFVDYAGSRTPA